MGSGVLGEELVPGGPCLSGGGAADLSSGTDPEPLVPKKDKFVKSV